MSFAIGFAPLDGRVGISIQDAMKRFCLGRPQKLAPEFSPIMIQFRPIYALYPTSGPELCSYDRPTSSGDKSGRAGCGWWWLWVEFHRKNQPFITGRISLFGPDRSNYII